MSNHNNRNQNRSNNPQTPIAPSNGDKAAIDVLDAALGTETTVVGQAMAKVEAAKAVETTVVPVVPVVPAASTTPEPVQQTPVQPEYPEQFKDDIQIKDIVKFLPVGSETRKNLIESRVKMLRFEEAQGESIRLGTFETFLKGADSPLVKAIKDAASTYKISDGTLAGRRFVITFPAGAYTLLASPATERLEGTSPTKRKTGSGGGRGFSSGASISFVNGAVTETFPSLHNFCEVKGIQYTGIPNSLETIQRSLVVGTKVERPEVYRAFSPEGKLIHYVPKVDDAHPGYLVDSDGKAQTSLQLRAFDRKAILADPSLIKF